MRRHQSSPLTVQDPNYGALNVTSSSSKYAIATFLTGGTIKKGESLQAADDYYYLGARILTYQLLHGAETRCEKPVTFIVLVTDTVSQHKREQLAQDGAKVVLVKDIPLRWWIKTGVTRWKDQFTKLRLFQMVEYDRILFLDADSLITRRLDDIFDEPVVRNPYEPLLDRTAEVKTDEMRLPAHYMFGARSDNHMTGQRAHPFPPMETEAFSAGFWVMAPSHEMFTYLLSVMDHWRRFDPHTMEQSLLNYAFRREGAMPWAELDYRWSATWPNLKDFEGKVVTLHEKLWAYGPDELKALWLKCKNEMELYYQSNNG